MTQVENRKRTARSTGKRTGGTTDATTTEGREAPAPKQPSDGPPPDAADAVMGLDMLLADGPRGPLPRFVPPARTTLRFAMSLAAKPDTVSRRARHLTRELGRI